MQFEKQAKAKCNKCGIQCKHSSALKQYYPAMLKNLCVFVAYSAFWFR